MNMLFRFLVVLGVFFMGVNCSQKQEPYESSNLAWPQWRGPNRDGISTETGLLKNWPPEGPKILWRTKIGDGFSGIVISHGRVYTMFGEGKGEYVGCFSVQSGKEIWRLWIDDKFNSNKGDGPRSTPTIDGDLIFALSANGKLHAIDTKHAKKIWKHNLKKEFGGRKKAVEPWRGYATSPLVEGNLLLVEVGGVSNGKSLVAFNKTDGDVNWTSYTTAPSYASPIAITVDGIRQVIFFPAKGLVSIAPQDGHIYWEYPWKTDYGINAATPIFIAPDKIFISSGYNQGAVVLQLQVAENEVSVRKVWKNRVMKNHFSTSIHHKGYIYGFDNAFLKCIDANTGAEKWKHRGLGKGSLVLADSQLIILGENGKLVTAAARSSGFDPNSSVQAVDGKCWTAPSVANGRLYIRNQHEMVCFDLRQGS